MESSHRAFLASFGGLVRPAEGETLMILHRRIDSGKGEGKFGDLAHQVLHLGCKAAHVVILAKGIVQEQRRPNRHCTGDSARLASAREPTGRCPA